MGKFQYKHHKDSFTVTNELLDQLNTMQNEHIKVLEERIRVLKHSIQIDKITIQTQEKRIKLYGEELYTLRTEYLKSKSNV